MKQKTKAIVVTAANGIPFYVRIVEKGERYGGRARVETADGGELELKDYAAVWDSEKAGVIFYDFRFACGAFGPMGQQVSTYYIDTILAGENTGLDLMGYEPSWKIDAGTMNGVRLFLKDWTVSK